jgi:hypothetical protein
MESRDLQQSSLEPNSLLRRVVFFCFVVATAQSSLCVATQITSAVRHACFVSRKRKPLAQATARHTGPAENDVQANVRRRFAGAGLAFRTQEATLAVFFIAMV